MSNRYLVGKRELIRMARASFDAEYANRPMKRQARDAAWLGCLMGFAQGMCRAGAISIELRAEIENLCIKEAEQANA